jgi:glycosyltransferase involved in cell wall biosynthesis
MRFLAPEGPQFYFKGLRHAQPIPYTALYASNLSAPTDWFREEPFDEGFPAAAFEDSELSYRWHRRGRTVLYWDSAVCRHRHHYESLEPFLSRQRLAGQAARFATRRHPGMAAQTVLQPLLVGLLKALRYGWRRLRRNAREEDLWDLKVRVAFYRGYLAKPARHSRQRPGEAPATETPPRVSVIVPVRDDPALDRLLASLAAQRHAPPFEVVIALDGSRREPNIPARLAVRLLRLAPRGPYAARNAAIAAARGEILVLTDSDCVCPRNWIALAERAFRDPSLTVLQGSSRPFDRKRLSRWAQQEYERYVRSQAADAYRHFCDTRNFAIRADLARALPFPEMFPKGGDGVYGRWLEGKRITIRYEPRWSVAHRDPSSRWRLGRVAFERGRYGEQWRAAAGIDLFGDAEGSDPRRGPGFWLLRRLPKAPLARRGASLGLLALAAVLGGASALVPEKPGQRFFSLFRRACHLSGRLYGESLSGASAGRAS